jgi:hypothetical protein
VTASRRSLGVVGQQLRAITVQSRHPGEVRPPICMRLHRFIQEHRAAMRAALALQRQRDEVAEPPAGIVSWLGNSRS